MPYLRLYLPETSIGQKRRIAEKLIDLTMHSFQQRRQSDRHQITIQFLSEASTEQGPACRVEVHSRKLASRNQQVFAEEVEPMLVRSLHLHAKSRMARLMGVKPATPPAVEIEFLDLVPDEVATAECPIGDALIDDWNRAA